MRLLRHLYIYSESSPKNMLFNGAKYYKKCIVIEGITVFFDLIIQRESSLLNKAKKVNRSSNLSFIGERYRDLTAVPISRLKATIK